LTQVISSQKFNEYIKTVCRFCGIDELVQITRTVEGKRETAIYAKYELVSSHTARRSFATNAYKAGIPILAIMAITGHSTEKVFMKYVRVSKGEQAGMISSHHFFGNKIVC
jgi:integrase